MVRQALEKCDLCDMPTLRSSRMESMWKFLDCENCGRHGFVFLKLEALARIDRNERARLAFAVRKVPSDEGIPDTQIDDMRRMSKLPPAMERVENLVVHMAELAEPGI